MFGSIITYLSSLLIPIVCLPHHNYAVSINETVSDSIPPTGWGLGVYNDLFDQTQAAQTIWPIAPPGPNTQMAIKNVLNFSPANEMPQKVASERRWESDSVAMEELSWSVGYGPRTRAWVLKPVGVSGKLPAILALHDHGGYKFYGKEKIADAFGDLPDALILHRREHYGGLAMANHLAKKGFLVLIHDVFLWGSRKFPLDNIPDQLIIESIGLKKVQEKSALGIAEYNTIAVEHENLVEKYCRMMGINLAGIIAYEDRVATHYLASRIDVDSTRIGCIGFSGGGTRSAFLLATCPRVKAAAIVSMMSTYRGMLQSGHNGTWMCFPTGLSSIADYADVASSRAPQPLLVQYNTGDELFTAQGMEAAHLRISQQYRNVGNEKAYRGQFYQGPHKFDREMQEAAIKWFKEVFATK